MTTPKPSKPSKPRNPVVRGVLNTPKRSAGRHILSQRKQEKDMDRMVGEVRAIDALKLLISERPWETEPNYVRFTTKNGLTAEIKRHPELLHLCGYLRIPKSHPVYEWNNDTIEQYFSVHGGLTHIDRVNTSKQQLLKIGFDCAHAGDFVPGIAASLLSIERAGWYMEHEMYRDIEFVKAEIQKLDDELEHVLTEWLMATKRKGAKDEPTK